MRYKKRGRKETKNRKLQ